jgi:hypothetical protein
MIITLKNIIDMQASHQIFIIPFKKYINTQVLKHHMRLSHNYIQKHCKYTSTHKHSFIFYYTQDCKYTNKCDQ